MHSMYRANQPPPEEGALTVPSVVSRVDFVKALEPLATLVGVEVSDMLADGFCITSDAIQFMSVVPIQGVEPQPSGDVDPEMAIWQWPVEVPVP